MNRAKKLFIGDIVKINDGSYAERLDKYEKFANIGLCRDDFKVIRVVHNPKSVTSGCKTSTYDLHDIWIKNMKTDAIYLHTSAFVKVIKSNASRINEIDQQIKKLMQEKEDLIND